MSWQQPGQTPINWGQPPTAHNTQHQQHQTQTQTQNQYQYAGNQQYPQQQHQRPFQQQRSHPQQQYPQQQHQQQQQFQNPSGAFANSQQQSFPNQQSNSYAAPATVPGTVKPNASYPAAQGTASGFGSHSQYPHQQQQQQQQQFFGSQFVNDFQSSATGQLGMKLGSEALQQGQQIVNQNINKYLGGSKVKYYFNVSTSYVINKLRVLCFPFRQKTWTRLVHRSEHNGEMEGYKPPREDLNAPDLYIPAMSLITYVIVANVLMSTKSQKGISPEVVSVTLSSGLFLLAFEVLFVKLGCYLLGVASDATLFDLLAYCGYQFVPMVATILFKFAPLPSWSPYIFFTYLMIAFGFFTLRTLKHIVLPESTTATVVGGQRQRRIYFLFIVAGLQVLCSFFLTYI